MSINNFGMELKLFEEVVPIIKKVIEIAEKEFQALPSRMKFLFHHVCELGIKLLADEENFIKTSKISSHNLVTSRILSEPSEKLSGMLTVEVCTGRGVAISPFSVSG